MGREGEALDAPGQLLSPVGIADSFTRNTNFGPMIPWRVPEKMQPMRALRIDRAKLPARPAS